MKKIMVLFLAIAMMVLPFTVDAKTKKAEEVDQKATAKVYMFRGQGCGFCAKALEYFDSIKDDYDFELITFEVWYNETNASIMQQVAKDIGETVDGVPFIVIGKTTFHGYADSYNDDIVAAIKAESKNGNANEFISKYEGLNSSTEVVEPEKKETKQGAIIVFSVIVIAGIVALVILARKSTKEIEA